MTPICKSFDVWSLDQLSFFRPSLRHKKTGELCRLTAINEDGTLDLIARGDDNLVFGDKLIFDVDPLDIELISTHF